MMNKKSNSNGIMENRLPATHANEFAIFRHFMVAAVYSLGALLLAFGVAIPSAQATYIPITVEESDASPSAKQVKKIKVSDGTLTDDGNGTVTITTSASVADDSLDFAKFEDTLDLDASTSITADNAEALSIINTGSANSLLVADEAADTSPFVIDANGQVGIGASAPNAKLHVSGGDILLENNQAIKTKDSLGNIQDLIKVSATNTVEIGNGSADFGAVYLRANPAYPIVFDEGSSERARITENGDLGIGSGSPARRLHSRVDDAATNAVTYVERLTHTTSGTPANGIGVGFEFEAETAANNNEIGATIESVVTDATDTSEDFDIVFKNMTAGAAATEKLRIDSTGVTTIGAGGIDGKLKIYSEQGGTDYSTIFQPGTQTEDVTYTLPNDNGGVDTFLKSDGSGVLSWATPSATISADSLDFIDLEDTLDLDAALILNQGANTWTQNFTGTTTTGLTYNANSLTSGSALAVGSNAAGNVTGALASFALTDGTGASSMTGPVVKVTNAGTANANTALMVTNAGGATSTSFRVNDDGTDTDSTPFVIGPSGTVGVGVASAADKLLYLSKAATVAADTESNFLQRIYGTKTGSAGTTYSNFYGLSIETQTSVTGSGGVETYALTASAKTTDDAQAQTAMGGIFYVETHDTDTGYGLYVGDGDSDGSGVQYGLYINLNDATSPPTQYGIYQETVENNVLSGALQLGKNGQDGQLILFNELGGTDYTNTFNLSSSQGGNIVYTLPPDDGDPGEQLQTDGNGVLTWEPAGSIADDSLDFAKFEDTLDLDAATIVNQGANTWTQNFTGTTTDGLTYNATSITSGVALTLNGPSGGTAGVTGSLLELNTDVGNTGLDNGGALATNVSVDTTGAANASNASFTTTVSNTGAAIQVDGLSSSVTDFSNQANTVVGANISVNNSPNTSTGTHNIIGVSSAATGKTAGTTESIAFSAQATGADNNYAFYGSGGNNYFSDNTGIGDLTADARLDIDNSTATLDSFGILHTSATGGVNAQEIAFTQLDDADATDTNAAINITATSSSGDAGDVLQGLNLASITGGAATERAIQIGDGWDAQLSLMESGTSPQYFTNFKAGDQSGDITYTLPTALPGSNQFLQSTTGGVLSWATPSASVGADSLDFIDLEDTLDLDAATEINLGANEFAIDLDSTGDFVIKDGGAITNIFEDDGDVAFGASSSTARLTVAKGSSGLPLDVRNLTDAASNQIAAFRANDRATAANDDEGYTSFYLDDSVGTSAEFFRLTVRANDVTNSSKDGSLLFYAMSNNALANPLTVLGTGVMMTTYSAQSGYVNGQSAVSGFPTGGAGNGRFKFGITNATLALSPNDSASGFYVNPAWTESGSGTHPLIANVAILPGTITGAAGSVTDTAGLYIENAPDTTVSGGKYSLWVDNGISRFDGAIGIGDASPEGDLDITTAATNSDVIDLDGSTLTSGNLIQATVANTLATDTALVNVTGTALNTATNVTLTELSTTPANDVDVTAVKIERGTDDARIVYDEGLDKWQLDQGAGAGLVDIATGAGGGANTALSNLASVAVNTSLISDTDSTDDLGSAAVAWKDVYADAYKSGTGNPLVLDSASGVLDINDGTIDLSTQIVGVTLKNDVANGLNFDSDTLSIDALNNRVGIGTNAPDRALEVNQTFATPGTGNYLSEFAATGTGASASSNTFGAVLANTINSVSGVGASSGYGFASSVGTTDDSGESQDVIGVVSSALTHPGDSAVGFYASDNNSSTGGAQYGIYIALDDTDVSRFGIFQQTVNSNVLMGPLQLGGDGQDGQFILFNELGATDYSNTFNLSGSQSGNIVYTLPPDDGDAGEQLQTNGSGVLSWEPAGSIADDSLDFAKFEDTLDLDAALVLNQGTNTWTQSFTGTTTDGLTYNANSLTSGSAVVLNGPSGGTAGVTDAILKITSDGGDAGTSAGTAIQSIITADGATGQTNNVYLSTVASTSASTQVSGIKSSVTDSTAVNNSLYGGEFYVQNNTNSSTGLHGIYGVYADAFGKTAGTTTAYGVYASAAGADNNYAFYQSNGNNYFQGNTGIGDLSADAKLDIDNTTATLDSFGILHSAATGGVNAQEIAFTQLDDADAADTNAAINVTATSSSGDAGDVLQGLNFATITGGAATERAIQIGDGWDSQLSFLESGTSPQYFTNFKAGDQAGDITYTLPTALPGSSGFLQSTSGGVLSWASSSVGADSLDFTDFTDTMALDASTSVTADNAEVFSIINTGTGNSFEVHDQGSDTTPFSIDADGRVGIATTGSLTLALTVTGNAVGIIDAGPGLQLLDNTAGHDDWEIEADSDGVAFWQNVGDSAWTQRATIDGSGNLGIGGTPDRRLHSEVDDATTNAVTYVERLTHTTSGTPASNIGVGIEFEAETSAGNNEIGATIEAVAVDAGAGTEDFDIVFKNMKAGAAAAETFRIKSTGVVQAANALAGGVVALVDGATIAVDASLGNTFYVETANSRTIGVPTNPTDGQKIIIRWKNTSGGSITTSFTTGSAGSFRFGTTVNNVSATPTGKTDYVGAIYNAQDNKWDIIAYSKGY